MLPLNVGDTVISVTPSADLVFGKAYTIRWIDRDGLIWVDIGWRKRGGYLPTRFKKVYSMYKFNPGDFVELATLEYGNFGTANYLSMGQVYKVETPPPYARGNETFTYLINDKGEKEAYISNRFKKANVKNGTEIFGASMKPSNPKDAFGDKKVPVWLCSPIAKAAWAVAQYVGLTKYGAWNWRNAGVRVSTYLSAMQRHMDAYMSGEEVDPIDQTPHLGHIMACCAIIMDAKAANKLTDDRPPSVSLRAAYAEVEKQMEIAQKNYGHMKPRHFTIADTEGPAKGLSGDFMRDD